jgi:hypothetical protein
MATERQIGANRADAKRSAGPRTNRGRHASSRKAVPARTLLLIANTAICVDRYRQSGATLFRPGPDETKSEAAHHIMRAPVKLQRVPRLGRNYWPRWTPAGVEPPFFTSCWHLSATNVSPVVSAGAPQKLRCRGRLSHLADDWVRFAVLQRPAVFYLRN